MTRMTCNVSRIMVAAAGIAAVAGWTGATSLVSGVAVTPNGATVVTMEPGGGVAALNAQSGQVRWTSGAADRPLLIAEGRVLAQVERLTPGSVELVLLGLEDGSALGGSSVAADPALRARVGDGLGEHFDIAALAVSGQRFVTWSYQQRRVQGMAPADGGGELSRLDGAAMVDFATASTTTVDPGEVPTVETPAPPAGFRQLVAAERLLLEPVRSGAVWAAVAARPGPAGATRLVLQRWNAADDRALAEIELWTGQPLHVWAAVADDVVLVAARTHPGEWQEYTWSVFRLATGDAAGEVRSSVALAPVAVVAGGLLLTERPPSGRRIGEEWSEQPRRLVALDPANGAEAWSRPLRDLVFRGAFPP